MMSTGTAVIPTTSTMSTNTHALSTNRRPGSSQGKIAPGAEAGSGAGIEGQFAGGPHTQSTLSVLSVPVMDPHFRDLMALRSDYSALFTQLKLTQQTLQYSYQDLVMAQERDKRSEVETTRLRAQMDVLLKKHVDHHPEQEALVRELGELQSNFDIEVTSRKRLEQDHAALQQEILRQRCSQSISNTALNSGPRHISIPTHSSSFVNSNPSASSSSAVSPSSPSTSTFASVTGSIRASSFASFLTGAALGGSRRGRASISNSDREPDNNLTKAEKEDATPVPDRSTPERDQLQGNVNITDDMTSVTLVGQEYEELSTVSSLLPSWEQIEAEKQVYENLREENVSLTMELKDLHHRLKAERDSIKSYMSLFESLQKKQANALAVAQSEIGLLRASAQDTQTRLASRQALIDTFAAAVNNQAADLETLTKELARERVSRAQVEQEMAGLLEASLVMIERWFTQLEQSRRHLAQVMLDPMRQAIERLEAPNLLQEWEQYELEVQNVFRELAEKLVRQQSAQDQELVTGVSVLVDTPKSNVKHGGGGFDMFKQLFLGQNDQPQKTSITTTAVTSTATVTIPSIDSTAMSAVEKGRNSENTISGDDLVLDNSKSQDVFLWRKFKADSFLEECVKSVEQLAKEKKELQTRIVELTKLLASHEEQSTVKSLAQQQQAVNPEAEDDLQESKDNEEEHGQSDSTQLQVAQTNDEPAVSESSMLQSPNPDDCGSDDKHPLSAAGQPIETPNDSVQDEKNLVSDKGQPTEVLSDGGSGDKDSLLDEGVLAEEIIKPTPVSDNGLLTDSGESCPPPGDSDRKISCQPTAMPSNANETGLVERAERLETALVRILVLANQQKRCTDTQSKPGNSTEDVVHSLGISDEAFEYEMLEQPAKADNDSVWQQSFSGHSAASSPLATDWHQLAQAIHQEYIVPLKRSCAGTTLTQLDIVLTSDHATLSEESTERAVRAGQATQKETQRQLDESEKPYAPTVHLGLDSESYRPNPLTHVRCASTPVTSTVLEQSNFTTMPDSTRSNGSCKQGTSYEASQRHQVRPEAIATTHHQTDTNGPTAMLGTMLTVSPAPATVLTPFSIVLPTTASSAISSRRSSNSSLGVSTPSTSYSTSSSSSYFARHLNIGGVSIPSSPGLGGLGGTNGEGVDLETLCRDLAFRSFPKQHQWSSSKNTRKDLPLTWKTLTASSPEFFSSASVPPLPPTSSIMSKSSDGKN